MRPALDEDDGVTQPLRNHSQQRTAEAGTDNGYIEISFHKRDTPRAAGRVETGSFRAIVAASARNIPGTSKTVAGPIDQRRLAPASSSGRSPEHLRAR